MHTEYGILICSITRPSSFTSHRGKKKAKKKQRKKTFSCQTCYVSAACATRRKGKKPKEKGKKKGKKKKKKKKRWPQAAGVTPILHKRPLPCVLHLSYLFPSFFFLLLLSIGAFFFSFLGRGGWAGESDLLLFFFPFPSCRAFTCWPCYSASCCLYSAAVMVVVVAVAGFGWLAW